MGSEPEETSQRSVLPGVGSDRRQVLVEAIERHWLDLLRGIQVYVFRFGLARDRASIDDLASEVLQDTVVTALDRYENYDPDRPTRPWLLGIAINHLRHRIRGRDYEDTHCVLVADSPQIHRISQQEDPGVLSEAEMFDLLCSPAETTAPGMQVTISELLSLVEVNDQEVLRLAFVEGLRGRALADRLGVSEGAAYTRQSRAVARLRKVYLQRHPAV